MNRKLGFFEIGRGDFAKWMQETFEDAQRTAFIRGKEVKITATITVTPPEKDDDRYAQVSYSVKTASPARQSMKIPVEVDSSGIIIGEGLEGSGIETLLQLDMFEQNGVVLT